ncbi:putative F-box protein At1g65770 [Humulus lupulus]|uniref:putative F-box protein At1g65770 n=1 Tax=Humulus lupulus TaxID=3486 RepID=UPI002B413B2C|nr:putative F-box protein At1g65770 [Humulus lupulus]XP_062102728.1 putative F-box protein At1g65770 [Humulus lupulus]
MANRDWSLIPDEIWAAIGRYLDNPIDVLRFRSVCSSWRTLTPPFDHSTLLPRFNFPVPTYSSTFQAFVSETTVYRINLPNLHLAHNPSTSSSSSDFAKGWLIKIEEYQRGKFRLLDSLSCRRIKDIACFPSDNLFDISQLSLTKLTTAYALKYVAGSSSIAGVNRVVLSPNSHLGRPEDCSIFVIYDNGKLGFAKNGEEDITLVDYRILDYNDLTVFRGQPYVVDRWGTVSWIDSSLRVVQYSPPLFGLGHRKHLVVSKDELFVVDRYLDENRTPYPDESSITDNDGVNFNMLQRHPRRRRRYDFNHPKSVDFKVYKLDEEWGRWVEVKCLGDDESFVLTYDCCFSISASEFEGFRENCIYFTEQFDMDLALRKLGRLGGCVFSLEDHTIEDLPSTPGYSQIFWPPPIPTRLCTD